MIHRHFSTLLFLTQLIYEVEWKFTLQLWKLKTAPVKLGGWGLVVGWCCPTFLTFCSLRLLNDTCDEWKNPEPCCQLLACTLVVWPLFWERCIAKSCCWICGRTSILRPSNTVVELSGRITPFKLKSPLSIRLKKHSGSSESFLLVTHVEVAFRKLPNVEVAFRKLSESSLFITLVTECWHWCKQNNPTILFDMCLLWLHNANWSGPV